MPLMQISAQHDSTQLDSIKQSSDSTAALSQFKQLNHSSDPPNLRVASFRVASCRVVSLCD